MMVGLVNAYKYQINMIFIPFAYPDEGGRERESARVKCLNLILNHPNEVAIALDALHAKHRELWMEWEWAGEIESESEMG